jgi:hypothetical protein
MMVSYTAPFSPITIPGRIKYMVEMLLGPSMRQLVRGKNGRCNISAVTFALMELRRTGAGIQDIPYHKSRMFIYSNEKKKYWDQKTSGCILPENGSCLTQKSIA